jgi:hypothetical protein
MYYKISDFLTSISIGGLTGLCTYWIVGTGWNMLLAMFLGMVIGMVLPILLFILIFMPLFGTIEIMIPSMITGILTGISSGIIISLYALPSSLALVIGGGIGVLVCAWIYIRTYQLKGEVL